MIFSSLFIPFVFSKLVVLLPVYYNYDHHAYAEAAPNNVRRKLRDPPLAGGYFTVTNFIDDPMTNDAATFVLSSLQDSLPYEFGIEATTFEIIAVSQQVVAGLNIRLTMLFQDGKGKCVGACNVLVYDHFSEMSVTSWNKQLTCEEAEVLLAENLTVIVLEDFSNPVHTWKEMNDPVMGGKSTGTFSIKNGIGKFVGEVVDVPFLHAPGFVKAQTTDHNKVYPDVTSCQSLQIIAKSKTDYTGYRISFGNAHAPGGKFFAFGYKANLNNVPTDDFGKVTIPFSQFTDFWDDATGNPIHTCEEDPRFCPDEMTLKNLKVLEVWGEGVGGCVDLEIQRIQAVGCNDSS